MRLQLTTAVTALSATLALAGPAWHSERGMTGGNDGFSPRPDISYSPKRPAKSAPAHPQRYKTCVVKSHGDGSDDAQYVLEAVKQCNDGGRILFKQDTTYTVATALDLSKLKHVDLDIRGTIQFTNDTDYWQANSFKFVFQNASSFWQIGGEDVAIYGGGTIDGNGQVWYDLYAANIYILRPILMGIIGLHDSTISDLVLRYSPQWYHIVANSTNVVFDNINIAGASKSSHPAKNTDGWDTYRSSDITIQNSVINNGDDCVAFKPNSTNILIQNVFCNGSHGISVGSLGQYPGEYDIVENVYVFNVSMHNASDGARIKVWPNSPSALSGDLQGGGGTGRVNNITYDTMFVNNVDYAIEINQCYGQKNITLCNQFPSKMTITNIVVKNFSGKTSKKFSPEIAAIACSSPSVCSNIVATNINVLSPAGQDLAYCSNVDPATLDVTCTNVYKGAA